MILTRVFLALALVLAGCGTTYQLPEIAAAQDQTAARMFAEARAEGDRRQLSVAAAESRFRRVAARIEPAGRSYCETLTAGRSDFTCKVDIGIDREMQERNAYFTYDDGAPIIRISMPMLRDTKSDDEAAFILGHEYGHLIGRHSEKRKQQQIAGAILVGAIAGAVAADAGVYDSSIVDVGVGIGAAAGTYAYSQSFELESDTLGTRIADAAGYDPVKGATFFARPEEARSSDGKLSFWGTHPPDKKRLATVLATVDQIEANVGLQKVQ